MIFFLLLFCFSKLKSALRYFFCCPGLKFLEMTALTLHEHRRTVAVRLKFRDKDP